MTKLSRIAMVGAIGAVVGVPIWDLAKHGRQEKLKKCGFPGCEKMSKKDYCSPEHCRQHREMYRIRRNERRCAM
jgi:hypothetical protein